MNRNGTTLNTALEVMNTNGTTLLRTALELCIMNTNFLQDLQDQEASDQRGNPSLTDTVILPS